MWSAWIALGVSSSCGMLHLLLWSYFYISYRDHDWKGEFKDGKDKRDQITAVRKVVMFFQFAGFAVGVLGVAFFATFNFNNVPPPK
jgi:hypothetical protein